jgi:hypothetical protein
MGKVIFSKGEKMIGFGTVSKIGKDKVVGVI